MVALAIPLLPDGVPGLCLLPKQLARPPLPAFCRNPLVTFSSYELNIFPFQTFNYK